MKMKGAKALIELLKEQNVDTIFGFPGGTVINIYDVLYDTPEINHILTSHEQGAAHAADGYARATGKPGVVLVTSGPGAANTVTGIATAYIDSVPMVVITGQVARNLIGKTSFQELDITSITKPITKKNYMVMEPSDLPRIVREAFIEAQSGRPGPVLIDIPKDIQVAEVDFEPEDNSENTKTPINHGSPYVILREEMIEKAIEAINSSKKPVIFAGGGVKISEASKELLEFSEKIKAPVACSLMGIGAFPGNHPLYMGMVGMHGNRCSNLAFTNCDLLIAVGARFSDRVICRADGFAPNAKIIHIDIDPQEFGKNVDIAIPLCGDVKQILDMLLEKIEEKIPNGWNSQISRWQEEYKLDYKSNGDLCPQYLFKTLFNLTEGKSILTTEVGQNQMWTAQFYPFTEPRSFISSGGLGTMGFGLGAAIGSAIGRPDKKVINVAGDGSFKMNLNELTTLARYRVPVIQLVLNNSNLGMVRQWQKIFYEGRFSQVELHNDNVDFVKVAEAFGLKAMRITCNEEAESVLAKALALNEPVVIDCVIHPEDMVTPMVPLGEPISETIEDI